MLNIIRNTGRGRSRFEFQVGHLCLVHVIWTELRMSKLVLNVKYLLLLSFLTAAGGTFKVL